MSQMRLRGPRGAPLELVCVGHVTVDHVSGARRLGGAAAYASLTAARLGLSVGVVTSLGADFPFWSELAGVEVHYSESGRTTVFENLYRDGTRHQRIATLADPLRAGDVADALAGRLRDDTAVLYCPVVHELELPLRRIAPRGLCAVAPQGFFRAWDEEGRVSRREWVDASAALQGTDVVSMSEEDADVPEEIAETYAGTAFVVTRGSAGCRLYSGVDVYDFPAVRAREVDPTGAGDVFAVSLLVALREGRALPEAVGFASAAAAISVEGVGLEALPTRHEIEGWSA